nr:gamma carbonic anhydrase family protein [Desulfobacterales bacterium]
MICNYRDKTPDIHPTVFVAPDVCIIGDVKIGEYSSIWYGTVIRGDSNSISIGKRTNIQDNCTIHGQRDLHPVVIGNDVTVAHNAVLHGCEVEDLVMIGIGAIVLNGARIGEGSAIAAGALVPEGANVPPRTLMMGVPAKPIGKVQDEDLERIRQASINYLEYAKNHLETVGM